MKIKDLKNHFLVAMPSITDPIFKKSLILICDDNKDGTMGLIVNKPIEIDDVLLMQNQNLLQIQDSKIYFGGPVNLHEGFVLHEPNYHTEQTINISNSLSLTSNDKVINDINKNNGPDNFLFTLGYSGWDKNQLNNEIQNGDWLIVPADVDSIFKKNDEEKWNSYSSLLGFDFNDLSGQSGTA
ncbi:MAG: hypothetical protein CMG66_03470 [Candidatus Marinimicrobia bacterium]|nr:hypothetical protein [Candidatus Neomarinimicrobiota bacterium]|tara:strand:+ start:105 stop:653 length:549 start_codon:yes stop_codon:yes gene_type:complete